DDRFNPAIVIDQSGKLRVFFSTPSGDIQLYSAKQPEDITSWEAPVTIAAAKTWQDHPDLHPVYLSEENKLYLFWLNEGGIPTYSSSDSDGRNWAAERKIAISSDISSNASINVKSNGINLIHLAFSSGAGVKYLSYQGGYFYTVNKQRLGNNALPDNQGMISMAHTGTDNQWPEIVDVAYDKRNNPVLLYKLKGNDRDESCRFTKWNGKKWIGNDLINSSLKDISIAGLSINPRNPSELYLSVKRDSIFEIEKWTTANGGKQWKAEAVTRRSVKNNKYPVIIPSGKGKSRPLWVTYTRYNGHTDYQGAIKLGILSPQASGRMDSVSIARVMQKTADWQLANPVNKNRSTWSWGVFYTGLTALYQTTHDEKYLNDLINVGQQHNWKITGNVFNADQLTLGQSYADAFSIKHDPEMIRHLQEVLDLHIARTDTPMVKHHGNPKFGNWWTWCDALYMAPAAFAKVYALTGEIKYLNYMDESWWRTSDYLYSKEDSLYFRDDRYFSQRSANGKKIFWGRGNGWVIGGLARVIPYLPKGYPNRERYIEQFKQMSYKLLSQQQTHGLWTASISDPKSLPTGESSGSALITFALVWGINNGLLPKATFEPAVRKAWQALVKNVNEDGRLGYVQPVAGSPFPFYAHQHQVYATGAFLLAGQQMIRMGK
ncbi:MAG TPA: glycoside hydrolase family 88 protein, partial [Sphingobacteriaceae bacterium]